MNNGKAIKIGAIIFGVALALIIGLYVWQAVYFRLPAFSAASNEEVSSGTSFMYDQFDILLLGIDSRETIDIGARTDTMIIASFDTVNNTCNMMSIPRDTRVKYKGSWMKINAPYFYDEVEGSVTAVNTLLGAEVDRYAVIDFRGVTELVDMVGGIDLEVPYKMYKPLEDIDLEPGYQHLDGAKTLAYMRYRDEAHSDFERSDRQKEVLSLIANKVLENLSISDIPELYETFVNYVDTNLTLGEMGGLAKIGKTILANGITTSSMPGDGGFIGDGWYYVAFTSELGLPANEAELELREKGWGRTTTTSSKSEDTGTGTDLSSNTDIEGETEPEYILDNEGNIIGINEPDIQEDIPPVEEVHDEQTMEPEIPNHSDGTVAIDEDPQ